MDQEIEQTNGFEEIERAFQNQQTGKGKRLVNYIVDRICAYLFAILIIMLLAMIFPSFAGFVDTISNFQDILLTTILIMVYYIGIESITKGRSVGKFITKTKVVDEDGDIPDFSTFLKRNLCRLIPFDALSYIFISEGGWHDNFSYKKVVDIE